MLTNREWASSFWMVVILALAMSRPGGRAGLRQIIGAFLAKSILVVTSLFVAWSVSVVAVARHFGLWDTDLAKDTVIWLVTVGLPILYGSSTEATQQGYFRRKVAQAIKLDVVLAFYLNLIVFPFIVEVLLQPVTAVVAFTSEIGKTNKDLARAKPAADKARLVIGVCLLAATVSWSIANFRSIDPGALGLSFLLPMWLLVGVLPLISVLSVLFSYQAALLRLRWHSENRRSPWKARLALVAGFRLSLRDLGSPGQGYQLGLARSRSFREGLGGIRSFRRSLRQAEAAERRRLVRLVEFAGVPGTDEEGHQLDQREFVETKAALEWLSICQMGWYRTHGSVYRPELLKIFDNDSTRHGLPAEHGIHLILSRSGRSWYAWRRTIGGWCFAIGAAKAPPDQWLYDGPEPPTGFPGRDRTWGSEPLEQTVNWEPS